MNNCEGGSNCYQTKEQLFKKSLLLLKMKRTIFDISYPADVSYMNSARLFYKAAAQAGQEGKNDQSKLFHGELTTVTLK